MDRWKYKENHSPWCLFLVQILPSLCVAPTVNPLGKRIRTARHKHPARKLLCCCPSSCPDNKRIHMPHWVAFKQSHPPGKLVGKPTTRHMAQMPVKEPCKAVVLQRVVSLQKDSRAPGERLLSWGTPGSSELCWLSPSVTARETAILPYYHFVLTLAVLGFQMKLRALIVMGPKEHAVASSLWMNMTTFSVANEPKNWPGRVCDLLLSLEMNGWFSVRGSCPSWRWAAAGYTHPFLIPQWQSVKAMQTWLPITDFLFRNGKWNHEYTLVLSVLSLLYIVQEALPIE